MRTLFEVGALGTMTDGQLLELFTTRRDDEVAERAFATLVERHGPMVLGVCRRILRDAHDSADAFQATFLVLARRARAVRVDHSLGRWLYGVSRRVALQARASTRRRSSREVPGAEQASIATLDPDRDRDRRELRAIIEEELARLPEKYRAAVVLCDLEGMKHDEAAQRLRCPVGTIESRLARGRELLRARLARRGVAPAALAATGIIAPGSARAAIAVAPALAEATARLARQFASGRTLALATAPTSVTTLTERTLKAMFLTRIKAGALGLLAAGTLAVGVVSLASPPNRAPGRDEADPPRATVLPPPKAGTPPGPGKPVPKLLPAEPGDLLRIEVLEALPGRPISFTRIVRPDGTISLEFYGDLYVDGLNRDQIKVKLIEHLRKYLRDEILGLYAQNEQGQWMLVDPVDSDRVFVEDHITPQGDQQRRLQALESKMEQLLGAIRSLRAGPKAPPPPPDSQPDDDKAAKPAGKVEAEPDTLPPEPSVPFPAPTRVLLPSSDPVSARPPVSPAAPATVQVPIPLPDAAATAHEERLREMERKLDRILDRLEKRPAREPR
jgi:RNA polymerase sigma factor (sigma-70 family)